jgi:hypothetical protein
LGGGASQFSIAAGMPRVSLGQTDVEVYALDDWRLKPNMTLSAGLRYEIQTNIHTTGDFGPRLALSWSPPAKNGAAPKTVVRLGSGLFYNRVGTYFTQQALRFNGRTQQQFVIQNPLFFPVIPTIDQLLSQATTGPQSLTTYQKDPQLRPSFVWISAATIERQLPGKTSVSLTYYRQNVKHLFQTVNINAPFPGTYVLGDPTSGTRPYGDAAGNIFQYEAGGILNLNDIWVEVKNNLNQHVSFSAYYETLDAHNTGDNGSPSNPYNLRQDYSRASWLRRHYFNLLGTFTAPHGVQFSPLLLIASGNPYDVTIGSDLNGDTIANDRPAFATDLSRPSVVMTPFGAFDTKPMPGQKLVPRNYLTGAGLWNMNMRVSKTFGFGAPRETPPAGYKGPPVHRYGVNFNVDVNNIFNHVNPGGFVGNLSSPLFGQSTQINIFRDSSNNRRVQFGTQFTF